MSFRQHLQAKPVGLGQNKAAGFRLRRDDDHAWPWVRVITLSLDQAEFIQYTIRKMSLIAGYLARNRKASRAWIERFLQSYTILAEDELSDYENLVIETQCGYLIQKIKKIYPVQNKPYTDVNGNTVLILGFLSSTKRVLSPKHLEESEGEFIAVYSEACGTVHIINDRFGSRPCYVLRKSDGVCFSSNLAFVLGLAGGKHRADVLGWFHMFSYGHTFGSRTTFSDVKRLPPGTHLVIAPDGTMDERRYWRLKYKPVAGLDPISHSTEVFEAFKASAATKSRVVGKGVIALSGGLDSRLVAAALPEDVDFSAFTFVNSGEASSTLDTKVADQVATVLGLEHHIQKIPRQEYSAVANDVIRLTGGMRPFHHMRNCDALYSRAQTIRAKLFARRWPGRCDGRI